MKLINLIPLREIDFKNQDQFDDYVKNHELRPDTKVTINGKVTTAGQAAKNSEPVKGTSVFGGDKGGSVFGGDKPKQINTPFVFKSQDSFNAWNKKYNLRPETPIIIAGEPTTAGDVYKNSPQNPSPAPKFSKKMPTNDDIEGLTSHKDFNKFFKANLDKLNKDDASYIKDEIGALKYLESDYETGDADREEVETAYIELQDLIKKGMNKGNRLSENNKNMKKTVLKEIKRVNEIAGTQMSKEQEILFIKNRLNEIDFKNQDQFDDYAKQHSLRPDTKVTIAGKVTTAGKAAQKSEPTKGSSVFGKDKGGDVFGKKSASGNSGGYGSKPGPNFQLKTKDDWDRAAKIGLLPIKGPDGKTIENPFATDKNNNGDWMDDLDSIDTSDIKGKANPDADSWKHDDVFGATFKDPETGKTTTVGDAYDREDDSPAYQKAFAYVSKFDPDGEAVMGTQAYNDLQKNAAPKADVKSIVKDLLNKGDKEFRGAYKLADVVNDFKDSVDDSDEDGAELKARLDKGENGVYVQTDETEGTVVFNDGSQYQFSHVEDGTIPVTKVGKEEPKTSSKLTSMLPKKASQLDYKHASSIADVVNAESGLDGYVDTDDNTDAIMYHGKQTGNEPTYTLYFGANDDYGKPDEFRVSLESTYGNDPAKLGGKYDKSFKSGDDAVKYMTAIAKKHKKELQMDDANTND